MGRKASPVQLPRGLHRGKPRLRQCLRETGERVGSTAKSHLRRAVYAANGAELGELVKFGGDELVEGRHCWFDNQMLAHSFDVETRTEEVTRRGEVVR